MYRSSPSSTCSMSNALAPSAAMRCCSSVFAAASRGRNALRRASKSTGGATRPAASARAAHAKRRRWRRAGGAGVERAAKQQASELARGSAQPRAFHARPTRARRDPTLHRDSPSSFLLGLSRRRLCPTGSAPRAPSSSDDDDDDDAAALILRSSLQLHRNPFRSSVRDSSWECAHSDADSESDLLTLQGVGGGGVADDGRPLLER